MRRIVPESVESPAMRGARGFRAVGDADGTGASAGTAAGTAAATVTDDSERNEATTVAIATTTNMTAMMTPESLRTEPIPAATTSEITRDRSWGHAR